MIKLLTALAIIATSFAHGEEPKDAIHSSFSRLGEKQLFLNTWPDADKKSAFYMMNVEPGCILIRVKLIETKQDHYTYEIVDSPGGGVMTKMAQHALGIKSSVFVIAFSEKASKLGDAEFTNLTIDGIKDKNNKANKMATPRKPSD